MLRLPAGLNHFFLINVLTAGHPAAAMIPLVYETDREVLEAAIKSLPLGKSTDAEVVHISNTLHLEEMYVSEVYLSQIEERSDLEVLSGPAEIEFDGQGNMLPVKRSS